MGGREGRVRHGRKGVQGKECREGREEHLRFPASKFESNCSEGTDGPPFAPPPSPEKRRSFCPFAANARFSPTGTSPHISDACVHCTRPQPRAAKD